MAPTKSKMVEEIDLVLKQSLTALARDPHVRGWRAKENGWVSYFAFRHLVPCCRPGSVLSDPAQLGIEVSVASVPSWKTRAVCRDIVIWPKPGMTCWGDGGNRKAWEPCHHPTAILEWKVHRPWGYSNKEVMKEREWLREYCPLQPSVAGYAIEVDARRFPVTINCDRFLGDDEQKDWLKLICE